MSLDVFVPQPVLDPQILHDCDTDLVGVVRNVGVLTLN